MAISLYRRSLFSVAMVAATLLAHAVLAPHAIDLYAQDADATTDETQHNEAGVMAVDDHWSLAELTGDTDWLNQMLLPEYRSVGSAGVVHAKADIVAGAAKRKGTDLATAKQTMEGYRKQYPHASAVTIRGDTAIITFYDPTLGPLKGVRSSDVFVYVDGRWHAVYSQHTAFKS